MQGHYNHVKKDIQVDFHGKHARYLYLTVMDTDTFESYHYMKTIFYLKLELIYVTKRNETSLTTFCGFIVTMSARLLSLSTDDKIAMSTYQYLISILYFITICRIRYLYRHVIIYIRSTLSLPQRCKIDFILCLLIGYCKSSISKSMKLRLYMYCSFIFT